MLKPNPWPAIWFLRAELLAEPEVAALPPALREATVFARLLARLPIGQVANESLAGDYGLAFADPELQARVAAWQREPRPSAPSQPDPWAKLAQDFVCKAQFSPAHTTADYEQVLQVGLGGLIERIERFDTDPDSDHGPEATEYRRAMTIALRGLEAWASRFAALGDSPVFMTCRRVPHLPAASFHEAVQALWLLHTAIGISELSDASLSLGRLDQVLYPYYRRDRDAGVPETAIEQTVADLFRKLNRYGDAACAVNLGGLDAAGHDQLNDLSRLILRVATALQQPAPLLAARIHPQISQADFDQLTTPELLRNGQPTFYGELACRCALERRGVSPADAQGWAANSCMGLLIPGQEFSDMWGIVLTLLLPLELALNHGRPFRGDLPIPLTTRCPEAYTGIDEVFDAVLRYTRELLQLLAPRHAQITAERGRTLPNPYLSALLRDCAARGRDRLRGGVRHHTVNVDAFGLVNAADALTALDRVVFRERRWTLDEVLAATRADFAGAEPLRRALLAAPKYGNDDAAADIMVQRLAEGFAAAVQGVDTATVTYMPSFHTLNAHVGAGALYGASADGRRAGEPLAKNIGPMPGRNMKGLTALLQSAASIRQDAFYGGQALDVSLDASRMAHVSERRAFQSALQTYFAQGGLQVQVNGVTAQTLREALAQPVEHEDIIVRIAGYSARFVGLNRGIQEEMVQRFEHGV